MSDPVVSNVRVTARAMDEPREGLPPCRSLARFDGRRASLIDSGLCTEDHYFEQETEKRLFVVFGYEGPLQELDAHGCPLHFYSQSVFELLTNDPDEAQAAFAKGAEWVRTGEGP